MYRDVKEYYIMGCGALGTYLRNFFADKEGMIFKGFLDNKRSGEGIYSPNGIQNKNIPVIVGSISYMYEMTNQLQELGFGRIIDFGSLTLEYPELQNYNKSYLGLREDYENNFDKYEKLYELFSDDKSKRVLDAIIEYRKTYGVNLYAKIADKADMQYCDDVAPRNIEVFVDGGAFDGDTVLRAKRHGFKMNKVYFFEPDGLSIAQAKENLKDFGNVEYFPCGLSDKEKILRFVSDNAFSSRFSEDGEAEVKCVSLDETVKEEKAFIKLDIEGAEYDAIMGAKRLFANKSPFAVCVYHKPRDIWEIPELINKISNKGYKFYLRHYTTNILETVLYGVEND